MSSHYQITQFEMGHIKKALMDAGSAQSQYALKLISLVERKNAPSSEEQSYLDHMALECAKHGSN